MKTLVIVIGSKSDLKQCRKGLLFLKEHSDRIKVLCIHISSIHRHTLNTQDILTGYAKARRKPSAILLGAGWAAHLIGCSDAFLRFVLQDKDIPVIGVAFADLNSEDPDVRRTHDKAAKLSISEVPGTQAIYYDIYDENKSKKDIFFGEEGFLEACRFITYHDLPELVLKEAPPIQNFQTIDEALAAIG